jgi:hypothetical protein
MPYKSRAQQAAVAISMKKAGKSPKEIKKHMMGGGMAKSGPYNAVTKYAKGGSTVNESGNYTKPGLRKRIFEQVKASGKGGAPGQWSARKAQRVALLYKQKGGGYKS